MARPLRTRIDDVALSLGVPLPVVEKDYAISYVLAGIARQATLERTLVLKGGTALKKLIFGDYRFSEDLDFTALDTPRSPDLEKALREALAESLRLLASQGPFALSLDRYVERDPHPGGQEAFVARVQFPWHPTPLCRVKLEVTLDEPVLLPPDGRSLIHDYEEDLPATALCYRIEEIVAEKLRTLLQTQQKLAQRGWSRPRARDYYDLWRLLGEYGQTLDPRTFADILRRKCAHRGVSFASPDDFFPAPLVAEIRAHWERNLGPFVRELPSVEVVLDELRALLRPVFEASPG